MRAGTGESPRPSTRPSTLGAGPTGGPPPAHPRRMIEPRIAPAAHGLPRAGWRRRAQRRIFPHRHRRHRSDHHHHHHHHHHPRPV
eukprot:scaffold2075_cov444-Prasinococcus_capsulatus_cf.AAC.1